MIIDTLPTFLYWFIPTFCFLIGSFCIVVLAIRTFKMQNGKNKYFTFSALAIALFFITLLTPYVFSIFTTELTVSTSDASNMQMIALSHPLLLEGLKRVQMTPPSLFTVQGLFLRESRGNYNPADRSIYIDSDDVNVWTWWHELGHHVWFILMTTEEKEAWNNHYLKQRALYTDGFYPTMYAKKNAREDFAESFMLYVGVNELRGYMIHPELPTGLDIQRRYMLETIVQRITGCENVTALCYYG